MHRLLRASALVFGSAVFATGAYAAPGDTFSVNGTVRDFCFGAGTQNCTAHPDFEAGITGVVTGLVQNSLSGGVPVLTNPGSGAGLIQSAASFAQWFADTPGVNTAIVVPITFTEQANGHFTANSSAFFPIDGQGFGNQNQSHNYHFTMHLQWSGAINSLADSFMFSGDDDVWVFANGNLFMDLGGIHGQAAATKNGADILSAAGANLGDAIQFDFFFAERHTTESNFNIDTSFRLRDTSVPEPAMLTLFGLSLVGLGIGIRRRRSA